MNWYAIFVETGKEDIVTQLVRTMLKSDEFASDYDLLVPKREVAERKRGITQTFLKNMFPGYVLLNTSDVFSFYSKARYFTHIYSVLHNAEHFREIELSEISNIIYMADEHGVIGKSDIFVEDDRVIVTRGPLLHYDGYITKIDCRKERAKVLFQFDGSSHLVDLSVNLLENIDDSVIHEILFWK